MKLKTRVVVWAASISLAATFSVSANNTQQNKDVVQSFFQLMFQEHQVQEAVARYVGEHYIQHNPYMEDGAAPMQDFFMAYFDRHPLAGADIKRVLAEGDLVMIHNLWKESPEDRGQAVVDIFRVADGKVVEHWDVSQDIPDNPANGNGMF